MFGLLRTNSIKQRKSGHLEQKKQLDQGWKKRCLEAVLATGHRGVQFRAVTVKLAWVAYSGGQSLMEKSLQRRFLSLYWALPGKFLQWGPTHELIFAGRAPCCQYFGLIMSEWVERQWTDRTSLSIKDGQCENKASVETCQGRNDLRWWLHGYKSFSFWQKVPGFFQLWLENPSKKFWSGLNYAVLQGSVLIFLLYSYGPDQKSTTFSEFWTNFQGLL